MPEWTAAVMDRTEEDVKLRTRKGVLNALDLNRVEENCAHAVELLGIKVETSAGWQAGDFLHEGDLARVAGNIRQVAAAAERALPGPEGWMPEAPDTPLNHWEAWNRAETILHRARRVVVKNADEESNYFGEAAFGQEIGVV